MFSIPRRVFIHLLTLINGKKLSCLPLNPHFDQLPSCRYHRDTFLTVYPVNPVRHVQNGTQPKRLFPYSNFFGPRHTFEHTTPLEKASSRTSCGFLIFPRYLVFGFLNTSCGFPLSLLNYCYMKFTLSEKMFVRGVEEYGRFCVRGIVLVLVLYSFLVLYYIVFVFQI